MSLINEMLRDLETRRSAGRLENSGLLDNMSATSGARTNQRRVGILLLVIVLLGLLLGYLVSQHFNTGNPASTVQIKAQQQVATTPEIQEPASTAADNTVARTNEMKSASRAETPRADAKPAPPAQPETKPITATPPRLVAIYPNPLRIGAGYQTLKLQGEAFVPGSQVQIRWLGGSTTLKERVRVIGSRQMEIQVRTGTSADTWEIRVRTPDDQLSNPIRLAIQAPQAATPSTAEEEEAEAVEEVAETRVEKRVRPLSRAEQAEQNYQKAHALLQHGRNNQAEDALRRSLELDPSHQAGHDALVGLLISQGRQVEALELLRDGLKRQPGSGKQAMLSARLLLDQQRTDEAIKVLENTLTARNQSADYLAFLAALYQREGLYQKSVSTYRRAISTRPGNGTWLMGLGISLEQMGNNEEAITAYHKALESGALSSKLTAYVKGRLAGLE